MSLPAHAPVRESDLQDPHATNINTNFRQITDEVNRIVGAYGPSEFANDIVIPGKKLTLQNSARKGLPAVFTTSGTGSPEGVVTAAVGSTYQRIDGAPGTTLYVKEQGTGNTGWMPVSAAAAQAVQQFAQNNIAADVPLTANVLTDISTLNLTMLSTGGPFRIYVSYSLYVTNTGGLHTDLNAFVTDGTNLFAGTEINEPATGPSASGVACSAYSPVTYENGTSVTFTLRAQCDHTTLSILAIPTNAGPNSFFQGVAMASM